MKMKWSTTKPAYSCCNLLYKLLKIEYDAAHFDYGRLKMIEGTLKLKNDRFLKIGEGPRPIDEDSINRVRSINASWNHTIELLPCLFTE